MVGWPVKVGLRRIKEFRKALLERMKSAVFWRGVLTCRVQRGVLCRSQPRFFAMAGSGVLGEEFQGRLVCNLEGPCSAVWPVRGAAGSNSSAEDARASARLRAEREPALCPGRSTAGLARGGLGSLCSARAGPRPEQYGTRGFGHRDTGKGLNEPERVQWRAAEAGSLEPSPGRRGWRSRACSGWTCSVQGGPTAAAQCLQRGPQEDKRTAFQREM